MIKTIITFLFVGTLVILSGCAKINPRIEPKLDQKINNSDGKIRDIENFQNGVKSDINGIKQNAELTNSKLDHVQNGLANLNSQQTNHNNGLQILSGTGGLVIGLVGIGVLGFILLGYRRQAQMNEKVADILAGRIVNHGDDSLKEDVFKAALYSDVEGNVLNLIKKHEKVSALNKT